MSFLTSPVERIALVRLPLAPDTSGCLSYVLPSEVVSYMGRGMTGGCYMVKVGARNPIAVCQRLPGGDLVCRAVDYPL